MSRFEKSLLRLQKILELHAELIEGYKEASTPLVDLSSTPYFKTILETFGPALPVQGVRVELTQIFDVAFHVPSQSLVVANKGVTLIALSPFTATNYITRHIACSVYHPHLGVETVNIGLAGNVYAGDVIVRAESACPPSFLFGSQRCNCSYQWASIRELAAHFNPIQLPPDKAGEELERWVESQFTYEEGRHLPAKNGQGVVLMHLDSQAGMGSGFTEGEFTWDLYNRALMRQLAENTTEQVYHASLKEGYERLGVTPDSRRLGQEAGYQIPAIVLEWLGVSRSLIALSNNPYKLKQLRAHGFQVKRVKSLGKIDAAGLREARQRGEDFEHLDMDGEELSFDQELIRLKKDLKRECVGIFEAHG